MSDTPWYKEGLRFRCTECGKCCTGSPGFVWVERAEIAEMAAFLGISEEAFIRHYTRKVGERLSLLEHSKNYDCVFLRDNRCQVYGARPRQCRTFPWWKENLSCPEAWEEVSERCEGVGAEDATLIPLEEIQKNLD